ncbi:TPA: DNA polymerase III subunit beta [Candidatus Peribacteria bacterium]|nr:MAG: DNA polymerase III subunit beta [Candidatus Peribacteria bacterium RIFOXYC2_FULL_58_10]OGJ84419.1 MAG: DNA polymerase III subunit beta [Candidatus Peribacteria bacterium RIFOXYD2_FULL_58_15]HAI97985.1 DNA polymerase III subunit beta [Candidatus Peribacteria bacterium]HAS34649.1 DNA polymerase III subunit beta [Candidatus Peribacteria bacterium]
MKFSCKTSELLQALQLVSRAIGGQQTLPILNNVLVEVEGKRCVISATDLELSIVTSFEANIENEGAITVPAKAILNFAQYNSDAEVLLETSGGNQLKCTSTHAKTLIAGESATEYPTITPIENEETFTIGAEPLLDALHMVTFASAKSTLRPVLSGVYLRAEKGNLIFVSTDSYRLSEYRVPLSTGKADLSCIIPAKVLEELKAVLGSKKGEESKKEKEEKKEKKGKDHQAAATIEIALSNQQIELRAGRTRLLSRLIDGKFPDYQQIIPKEAKTKVTVPVRELLTVIRRMHYFAKEINNNITFRFSGGKMQMTTPQTQMGKDEATLEVSQSGKENKIALSSSYLLDFLNHMENEEVEVQITDSMHPAVFRLPGKEFLLHLIMPLRLQEE